MDNTETKKYHAAIYLRLSREDGDVTAGTKKESNSISNQKELILEYLEQHPEIKVVSIREDDGYSGVNFDRPGFLLMQEDIKNKVVDCVIVKDLSRFGRNYIETGRYLEKIYPTLGVRFIAINDDYDSMDPNGTENILIAFKNLMNDSYLRDISTKIRSHLKVKITQGQCIAAFAVYGYLKSEDDRHKLVIDPFAGEVVKDIFRMRLDGMSSKAIAEILNDRKILCPLEYKKSKGYRYSTAFKKNRVAKWSNTSVSNILTNEIYTGVMVQGKTTTPNHKIKTLEKIDPKNWTRVENTHEPIVDKFYFEIVQKSLERDTRCSPKTGLVPPLSGMVFCGDCGNVMTHNVVTVKKEGKITKKYHYNLCGGYAKEKTCTPHRILADELIPIVLDEIRFHVRTVLDLREAIQDIDEAPLQQFEIQKIQKHIELKQDEIKKMQFLLNGLYADLKDEILSKEEYFDLKKNYENQIEEANIAIELYVSEIENISNSSNQRYGWMEYFKEYQDIQQLTRKIAMVFIDRILIYEDHRIVIKYNFTDMFEKAKEEYLWLTEEYRKEIG